MKDLGSGIITILTAIIGVAILAVVLSKQSQTASVLTAAGSAFNGLIKSAVSPIA